MALRPCNWTIPRQCPNLVKSGYCAEHEQLRRATTESHRWVYRDRRWYRCRRRALERAGWQCEEIENGRRCPAVDRTGRHLHGDHTPLGVRELLQRGLDPFDERRVKIRCASHHGRIEAARRRERSSGQMSTRRRRRSLT